MLASSESAEKLDLTACLPAHFGSCYTLPRELQRIVDGSVSDRDAPFLVGMVGDRYGIMYSGAAGEAGPGLPANDRTFFRIFSMSKPFCAVAIMMLIERGLLDPDTPIEAIVPEFARIGVLEGYDGTRAKLRTPTIKATVRHLATHTSGLEYEFWNPSVAEYMKKTGHPSIINGTLESMLYPMMTEPGTRWGYGPSIDWLGLVVERIDGRRIDRFCAEEIFDPLGLHDTLFELEDTHRSRLCVTSMRAEHGGFTTIAMDPPSHPEVYGMGTALYSTPYDFMRFMRFLLSDGELDGERLLSASSIERLFADQMQGLSFQKMISCAPVTADVDPFPHSRATHSFAFLRNEDDIPGMRSAGSAGWAGVLNSHYWIDRSADVAGLFMSQSLPFFEPRFMQRYEQFERCVYTHLRRNQGA